MYKTFLKVNSDFEKTESKNPICHKCQIYIAKLLDKLFKIFNNLELIKRFKDLKKKNFEHRTPNIERPTSNAEWEKMK